MQVGEILNVKIDDYDHEGLGVAHINNMPIFIPNAIPGEMVKIKVNRVTKNLAMADNLEIISKSDKRSTNICPYYESCGGCNIMHMDYQSQIEFKTTITKRTIKKVSGLEPVVRDCEMNRDIYGYRNKIIVPFGMENSTIISGFYEAKSHNIVNMDKCMIEPEISREIIGYLKELIIKYNLSIYDEATNKGLVRNVMLRVSFDGNVMVVLVVTNNFKQAKNIADDLSDKFKCIKSVYLNINNKKTNVVLQDEYIHILGDKVLIEKINGLKFEVHPNSFLQINHYQCERMYKKAIELASITPDDVVIDAYCGIGSISLNIAKKAKYVYGIEVVKEAIDNANRNMKLNDISNASFICGKCEDEIEKLVNNKKIDIIFFDPPRKGCDINFLNTVIKAKIERIVYISCKTSTFARDVKYLCDNGYEIEEVIPFDLFSHSVHVESVTLLVKR